MRWPHPDSIRLFFLKFSNLSYLKNYTRPGGDRKILKPAPFIFYFYFYFLFFIF